MTEKKKEWVNSPDHYGGKKNPYEVIKVLRAWGLGFSLGNAVKYIARAGKKSPEKTIEDLEKAVWYVQEEIDFLRGGKVEAEVEPEEDLFNFNLLNNRVFDNNNLNSHRFVSYSLPRQSGTTTYLVNKYNELKKEGHRVLFIGPKLSVVDDLSRYPRFDHKSGKIISGTIDREHSSTLTTVTNKLRGRSTLTGDAYYDYILMDNTIWSDVNNRKEIIATLLNYCNNTILEINTVE